MRRAIEHVLRNFFPAPHFLLGGCIKLLSIFCGKFFRLLLPRIDVASYTRACFAQFFPCSSLPNRKLHQATERNLRKLSSPPPFPNWCRIMLLSFFCVVELWPLIFQLKIALYYWACFAQFFPCSSLPNRKLYQATEHNLPKFFSPPPFPNWFRIMLLSTFCVVELWPLVFLLKIASCYWACFAQFFSCSSFPIRKLYNATGP